MSRAWLLIQMNAKTLFLLLQILSEKITPPYVHR